MSKKILSVAIIIIAAGILIVNIWKPLQTQETKESPDVVSEETTSNNQTPEASQSGIQEGMLASDFHLTTLDGGTVKLSEYKGKKVILNFWATWCPPCKAEMPHMESFYKKNKDKGIEIVAVNLTNADKGKTSVENFAKEYGLTFKIALDQQGEIGKLYQAFTIPTSYIIDTKGIITKKIVGPMDESMMENLTNGIE